MFPAVMYIFTWITWQNMTSLYGLVESCGCFGEVIHLTPAQTFWKNVVLLALSLVLLGVSFMEKSNKRVIVPKFNKLK